MIANHLFCLEYLHSWCCNRQDKNWFYYQLFRFKNVR